MQRFFVGCAILAPGLVLDACELRAEVSVKDAPMPDDQTFP